MRVALLQLNSSDDPAENLVIIEEMVADAVRQGAEFVLTPEVSNCVSASRARQEEVLRLERDDPVLAGLCRAAERHGIWILVGSLAVKTGDADGRFANRSFLIDPNGLVIARYDKIHMFDVDVSAEETYRESAGYRPGDRAVLAQTPWGALGMTVCYDLRFPHLYRGLAQAGAAFLSIPAAFSPVTGAAHWEVLLRARAIETGCFVFAPAQTGTHRAMVGKSRKTYGNSIVIAPWGEVLLDAGAAPGVYLCDIDPSAVEAARRRVPSIFAASDYEGPK